MSETQDGAQESALRPAPKVILVQVLFWDQQEAP